MRRPLLSPRLLLPLFVAFVLILAASSRVEAARYELDGTFTAPTFQDSFGDAILATAERIFVGAPFETGADPHTAPGALYVFDAGTGVMIRRLESPVAGGQGFGAALTLVGDVLVVGEPYGVTGPGVTRGLVHFFDAASGALIKTVPNPSADHLSFGAAVSTVGGRVAVAAPSTFTYAAPADEAFVLDVPSGDVVATLTQPADGGIAGFGAALTPAGGTIVAGNATQRADLSVAGAAYVYDATTGAFARTLDNPEPLTTSQFGWAIAPLGTSVAIAAPFPFSYPSTLGAVFLFDPTSGALQRTLHAPAPEKRLQFGLSLAAVGNLLLIGAPPRAIGGEGGTAFLFDPATGALAWDFTAFAARRFGAPVASDGRAVLVRGLVDGQGTVFRFVPTCGDGFVDSCETCDDGNDVAGDGCDATCMLETCGNGVVDPGEACDDGNAVDGDGCDHGCLATGCGNCVVTAGEECDDGNDSTEDHCDPNCTLPRCGNAVVGVHETCDDAGTLGGDGCSADCKVEVCGDAFVDAGESCDDGNHANGDGCDANCRLETARLGWWKPVFAFPDTQAVLLRDFVGVAPGGPVAVLETSFDVFQAQLFDPATGALLHTFPEVTAWRAAVIAGDVWVAASGSPAVVNRYDGSTFALRQSYVDPNPNGGGGAFGGALALVGDHALIRDVVTHTVEVFDAATGAHERALEDPGTGNPVEFGASIVAVAGQAVIGGNGLAYVFDPATGAYLRTLTGENGAAFDGARLVVLGDRVLLTDLAGGLVYAVSPATGEVLHTFLPPGNPDPAFGRYLAVLGDAVLIAGADAVHVFDAATYARRWTIRDPHPHGCFGYTMFDTPFGFAISDVCSGENFNGIVYVFDHDDGRLVAALPDAGGGDSESGTRAVGAYGTTLLVWHQEDESAANSAVVGYRPCADGVLEPGEECDDGNLESGDGCDSSCTLTRCGNGIVTAGEECDDGNRHPGDGCENDCTVSQLVCAGSVQIEHARLVMRHLGDPAGDEALTLEGRMVPPPGTTLDPLAAAAAGAQILVEDVSRTRILDLTAATAIVPPGARGAGCDPRDGWRSGTGRAVYTNTSNALDAGCTPDSAQGLRRLEVRRRMHDGGIDFRLRVGPAPLVEPAGPLKIVIALGAGQTEGAGAACGATFAPLPCERNARGTALVCR